MRVRNEPFWWKLIRGVCSAPKMSSEETAPSSKRQVQERTIRRIWVLIVCLVVFFGIAIVPRYLIQLREATAGRQSVRRWLGKKHEIRERYLELDCG